MYNPRYEYLPSMPGTPLLFKTQFVIYRYSIYLNQSEAKTAQRSVILPSTLTKLLHTMGASPPTPVLAALDYNL
ncbi:hypothetical protein BPAE_0273g00120 [Botrytis paeoniae]|uniref:Uncharacterized protein n=1 Tax=Botrytis paeoniae TaxID=278948 RepID=A0A4Z1F7D8_9HELO|nr:hypothetical protein BPAE_0273g00120 [Botrytis paeoniae]